MASTPFELRFRGIGTEEYNARSFTRPVLPVPRCRQRRAFCLFASLSPGHFQKIPSDTNLRSSQDHLGFSNGTYSGDGERKCFARARIAAFITPYNCVGLGRGDSGLVLPAGRKDDAIPKKVGRLK